ncbi:MAG: serine/threonine-protein kinase [Planctomycetota bacterium]
MTTAHCFVEPAMSPVSVEDTSEFSQTFVTTALRYGFIKPEDAQRIAECAELQQIDQATAATDLELLPASHIATVIALRTLPTLVSGYTLDRLIGCGAAGIVFRARQDALDRDVALKLVPVAGNEVTRQRLQREARSIAQLQHPHIITAYDSGVQDERLYIAMELVEGEDLATRIGRERTTPELAWRIARQIASALAHANAAGIIHRDIKPANILLTQPAVGSDLPADVPLAKVADFGLAYQTAATAEAANLTASGATLGTPAYVAPEQLQQTHVDSRADIYALGATLFHMLTGQPPYHDYSPMRAIVGKISGDEGWRERIRDVCDEGSAELIEAMTAYEPEDRIGDYEVLIGRIDQVLQDLSRIPANAAVEQPLPRPARPRNLARFVVALLGTLALLLLTVGGGLWMGRSSEAPLGKWETIGIPQPLFNGLSVPIFQKSGSWSLDTADDGSLVLAANDGAQMTIPLSLTSFSAAEASWQFRVSIQPNRNAIATLRFDGISQDETNDGSIRVRVEAGRVSIQGANVALADYHPVDVSPIRFHDFSVSREGRRLSIHVNGNLLATFKTERSQPEVVSLQANGGEALFADIDLVELRRSPAS